MTPPVMAFLLLLFAASPVQSRIRLVVVVVVKVVGGPRLVVEWWMGHPQATHRRRLHVQGQHQRVSGVVEARAREEGTSSPRGGWWRGVVVVVAPVDIELGLMRIIIRGRGHRVTHKQV